MAETYATTPRPPAVRDDRAALPGHRPGHPLQRLQAELNESPSVAALKRVGELLARPAGQAVVQRTAAGAGVVQRETFRFELTIPASRSRYNKELVGRAAYDWIVTNHGQPAIDGIKAMSSLAFRDGGMFVLAASRDWVVSLMNDLHLGRNVAVGGAQGGRGSDDDEEEAQDDARDEERDEDEDRLEEDGEDLDDGADDVLMRPFTLSLPLGMGPPEEGEALYQTLRARDPALLEELGAQVEDGGLIAYGESSFALRRRLAEAGWDDVEVEVSVEDIARELPDLTVGTMSTINDEGTISYPYNFTQEQFIAAADYFREAGFHGDLQEARAGFADPRYFERTSRFTWMLRPGISAALAIDSFVNLAGRKPVIADCQTAAQAVEYYAILQTVGPRRFDAKLGRADFDTPAENRLRLQFNLDPSNPIKRLYETPRINFDAEEQAGLGEDQGRVSGPGQRPAKRGGRYYIQGPAGYVTRHPEGFLAGENAFYYGEVMGEQRFGGLGLENQTELEIAETLATSFNDPPTESEAATFPEGSENSLHQDVLPPELQASDESVATVHRERELRAAQAALDGTAVAAAGANREAEWEIVNGQLVMNRTACDRNRKISLRTLAEAYAAALGLQFVPGLAPAIREVNNGVFMTAARGVNPARNASENELVPVMRCRFPDPAVVFRLMKGTGFQATGALILDPQKVRDFFS